MLAIQIDRGAKADSTYEYGCDLRRVFPWNGVMDPQYWGAAIASVRVGEATTAHSHDEDETFVVLGGSGRIFVDEDSADVESGDVILLPRGCTHSFANTSEETRLEFLTIFWGSPEAKRSLKDALNAEADVKGAVPD